MALANHISWLMILVVSGLIAWYVLVDRRHLDPPDMETRRRRFKIAWEVRALVIAAAGPVAMAIGLGSLSAEYALPLALFVTAGFLVAGFIAPSGIGHRR